MFWRVAGCSFLSKCLMMVTHEKTCPPYLVLNVDTGFTARAVREANSILAKKLCQDTSSHPGLSLVHLMILLLP